MKKPSYSKLSEIIILLLLVAPSVLADHRKTNILFRFSGTVELTNMEEDDRALVSCSIRNDEMRDSFLFRGYDHDNNRRTNDIWQAHNLRGDGIHNWVIEGPVFKDGEAYDINSLNTHRRYACGLQITKCCNSLGHKQYEQVSSVQGEVAINEECWYEGNHFYTNRDSNQDCGIMNQFIEFYQQ